MDRIDILVVIALGLVVLAALGVAGYLVLRRLFERAADRVSQHIGLVLADLAGRAATTRAGQRSAEMARTAVRRLTPLRAYAAAEGRPEDEVRREFAQSIERTARIMDSAIRLPLLGPVGLDALLGLFPVAGDAVSAAVSVSLIAKSLKYGVPHDIIARMLANVLIDMLLGAVPVAGDVVDMWFRANSRNVELLRTYLDADVRDTIDVAGRRLS